MSMTREEAINRIKDHMAAHHIGEYPHIKLKEALDMAISALRPVSREQVEKVWRGCSDCARKTCVSCKHFGWAPRHCVDCDNQSKWAPWNFCPVCGSPMTDEAVDILLRRLEALHEADLI